MRHLLLDLAAGAVQQLQLHAASALSLRQAKQFRSLFQQARAPIFAVGADGHVTEWNDMMAELTNCSRGMMLEGRSAGWEQLYATAKDAAVVDEAIAAALRGGGGGGDGGGGGGGGGGRGF